MNRNGTTARLWLAHLALVEADHHTAVPEPLRHPLGVDHGIRQREEEGERLLRVARRASEDALLHLGERGRKTARDNADAAWWRRK